jgi:ribosomal protein S12 methylthiotransferase
MKAPTWWWSTPVASSIAKAESLNAIGEAIAENGKVIVTGCMGVDEGNIRGVHPSVLAVTGPQQYEQVVSAVHEVVSPQLEHNPLIDLVPPQGIKLTPRHYAYLRFPRAAITAAASASSPPCAASWSAERWVTCCPRPSGWSRRAMKGLLVSSQDTSAYGVDLKYRLDFWNGQPVKTRMLELCEALSGMEVWVRLHYVYPYPNVDDVIPLMAAGKLLPYLDILFQHASPKVLKSMKRPAFEDKTLARITRWREIRPELTIRSTFIIGFPGETEKDFQYLLDWLTEAQLDRVGCFQYSPVEGAPANELAWSLFRTRSSRIVGSASWRISSPFPRRGYN